MDRHRWHQRTTKNEASARAGSRRRNHALQQPQAELRRLRGPPAPALWHPADRYRLLAPGLAGAHQP
jgi:hypothetical protein